MLSFRNCSLLQYYLLNIAMLVIGNGESRKHIDISKYDKIKVGCNAIFRDFYVNHLVCCDRRMVIEAQQTRNYGSIYTRPDWRDEFKPCGVVPKLPYKGDARPDDPWHWGSGAYALLLGANLSQVFNKKPVVDIIGFDLYSDDKFVNNMYKNTKNYDADTHHSIDPSYWIYQAGKVFEHFPNIEFRNYNKNIWPDKYNNLTNYAVGDFNVGN